jgi:zinc protease
MKRAVMLLLLSIATACSSTTPATAPPAAAPVPAPPVSTPSAPLVPVYLVGEPQVVTLGSPSSLIGIQLVVRHGSTSDAPGKEGLALLTAQAIVDGGFGKGAARMTKEQLARLTTPWGSGARPGVFTSHRTTTFFFAVPRDVLPRYVREILRPMLVEPAFDAGEIDRLKKEIVSSFTSLRSENLEQLGLAAIDQYLHEGTRYAHLVSGRESTMAALTREDVLRFYRDFYRPENVILGLSSSDGEVVGLVKDAIRSINADATSPSPTITLSAPAPIRGRIARVIAQANAPAASVHLGFPIEVNRLHPDFWPLYVANVWFGTHRDSAGQLYQTIREERGYNYGNYSYLEYWPGRPFNLFPVFNTPREQQSFSIWIRPVKHEHAVHLAKAATWELEQLVRRGLTAEELEEAKTKASVLYLNLGETASRLLSARVDDAFLRMDPGYLDSYVDAVERVTLEQANAAIRRHLKTENIKYLIITTPELARETARLLQTHEPVWGKSWADYEFASVKTGDATAWQVPQDKMTVVQRDAAWAWYPLQIRDVALVEAESLFR